MRASILLAVVAITICVVCINAAAPPIVGIYYQVIGTGNFQVHRVSIDPNTANVTDLGQFANAYASYQTPGVWLRESQTYVWAYPTPYSQTELTTFPANDRGVHYYYANDTANLADVNGVPWALVSNSSQKAVWLSELDLVDQQTNAVVALPDLVDKRYGPTAYSLRLNIMYAFVQGATTASVISIDAATGGLQLNTQLDNDCSRIEQMWAFDDSMLLVVVREQPGSYLSPLSLRKLNPATGGCSFLMALTTSDGAYSGAADYDPINAVVSQLIYSQTKAATIDENKPWVAGRSVSGHMEVPAGARYSNGAPMFDAGALIVADLRTQTIKTLKMPTRYSGSAFANIRFAN